MRRGSASISGMPVLGLSVSDRMLGRDDDYDVLVGVE